MGLEQPTILGPVWRLTRFFAMPHWEGWIDITYRVPCSRLQPEPQVDLAAEAGPADPPALPQLARQFSVPNPWSGAVVAARAGLWQIAWTSRTGVEPTTDTPRFTPEASRRARLP